MKRKGENIRIKEKRYGISSQTIGASVLSVQDASAFEVAAELPSKWNGSEGPAGGPPAVGFSGGSCGAGT